MTIRNNDDLRVAYEILSIYLERLNRPEYKKAWADYVVSLKREIRAFTKAENKRPVVAFSDEDSVTYLQILPESIQTTEEADAFFYDYMERVICSPHDCTGKLFTVGHKVFQRHSRFYVYHTMGVDV